jgi:hypothetical protein
MENNRYKFWGTKPTPIPTFPLKGKEWAYHRSKTAGNYKLILFLKTYA